MMDSMIINLSLICVEIIDVVNVVFDGVDVVMLSGEIFVGKYFVKVVEVMNKIIEEVEMYYDFKDCCLIVILKIWMFYLDVICFNVVQIVMQVNVKVIIGMISLGYIVFKVLSYWLKIDIYIFFDCMYMFVIFNFVWGVCCFYYDWFIIIDEIIVDVMEILKCEGCVKFGDVIINMGSMLLYCCYWINMMKIMLVE